MWVLWGTARGKRVKAGTLFRGHLMSYVASRTRCSRPTKADAQSATFPMCEVYRQGLKALLKIQHEALRFPKRRQGASKP